MGQNQKKDITEYDLDHLVQSAFNYGDDQLLEEMQKAEEAVRDDQVPTEPEDGFERLMAKMKERASTAYSESDEDAEGRKIAPTDEPKKHRKNRGLHTIIRIAIAAAIVGSVFTMTCVTVGAKKSYEFEARKQGGIKNSIVINNEKNKEDIDSLEKAYEEVHNQLGIRVLIIKDKPQKMKYLRLDINPKRATVYFELEGEIISLMQQIRTTESSSNITSDCIGVKTVYNEWLQKDIVIQVADVDNKRREYSTTIVDGNSCYYLTGIMDEQIFETVVQNLEFAEKGVE